MHDPKKLAQQPTVRQFIGEVCVVLILLLNGFVFWMTLYGLPFEHMQDRRWIHGFYESSWSRAVFQAILLGLEVVASAMLLWTFARHKKLSVAAILISAILVAVEVCSAFVSWH